MVGQMPRRRLQSTAKSVTAASTAATAIKAARPASPEPPLEVLPVAGACGTAVAVPWFVIVGREAMPGEAVTLGAVSVDEIVGAGDGCWLAGADDEAAPGGAGVGVLPGVAGRD